MNEKLLLKIAILLIMCLVGHNIYLQFKINTVLNAAVSAEHNAKGAYFEAEMANLRIEEAQESIKNMSKSIEDVSDNVERIWLWMPSY